MAAERRRHGAQRISACSASPAVCGPAPTTWRCFAQRARSCPRGSAWRSAASTTSPSTTPTCRARATRRRWRASRSRSKTRTPSSSPRRSTTTPSRACSRMLSTGLRVRRRPAACAGSPSASWGARAGIAAPSEGNSPCGRCSSSPIPTPCSSRNCACPRAGERFDQDGRLVDADLRERLGLFLFALVDWARTVGGR